MFCNYSEPSSMHTNKGERVIQNPGLNFLNVVLNMKNESMNGLVDNSQFFP